jgi:hypothetical protein
MLPSGNGRDFSGRFPMIARALEQLPDEKIRRRQYMLYDASRATLKVV